MNETELERIVVRLVGDGSEYQKMLTDAAAQTTKAADLVKQAANRIEGFKNSLVGFGQQMLGALGMFGVTRSLWSAFEASQQLEQGQIRLRNTIQAMGHDVTFTTARFAALAQSISDSTLVTKGEVFGLAQRATMMGLNADQTERVVRTSIALAGVTKRDSESMLQAAAAIERGNYHLAQRMILGRGVRVSEEEIHRVVANMTNAGWRIQNELAETAAGKLEKLGRSLRGINIEIGGMVASVIQPTVNVIKQILDWFNSLESSTRKATAGLIAMTLSINPLISSFRLLTGVLVGWPGLLAAAAGAAALMWLHWNVGAENAKNSVLRFWDGVKAATEDWVNYFKYAFNNFDVEWERLKTRGQLAFAVTFNFALNTFNHVSSGIRMAWQEVTAFIEMAWVQAFNRLRNAGQQFGTWLATSGFGQGIMRMFGYSEDVIRTTVGQLTQEQRDANRAMQAEVDRSMREIQLRRDALQQQIAREMEANQGRLNGVIEMLQGRLRELDQDFQNRFIQFNIDQAQANRAQRRALDVGQGVGQAFTQGVKAGVDNMDAVLAFSAEAFSRLANYRDAVLGNRPTTAAGQPPRAAAPLGNPAQVAGLLGVGGGGNGGAVLGVLGQIAASTRQTAERPPVQINAANLEE